MSDDIGGVPRHVAEVFRQAAYEPIGDVVIRTAGPEDLPALQRLSPPEIKPPVHFSVYATLVAEVDGDIAGYTQFSLTPDGVLHSLAIRIGGKWKGRGIGQKLIAEKERLAVEAGARMHLYAVDRDGEVALKKILEGRGMHLCQRHGDLLIYMKSFDGGPE